MRNTTFTDSRTGSLPSPGNMPTSGGCVRRVSSGSPVGWGALTYQLSLSPGPSG